MGGAIPPWPEGHKTEPRRTEVKKGQRLASITSTAFALLGTVLAVIATVYWDKSIYPPIPSWSDAETIKTVAELKIEVGDLRKQIKVMETSLTSTKSQKPTDIEVSLLSSRIGNIENQIKALADALGQTPDKALSVPLLRKDLENLKETNHRDLEVVEAEVNRVYDQNKWFIGIMATIALSLFGVAISNIVQARKG
jgi:hypothetical protein